MIQKQPTDRWNLAKARKPIPGKTVLVGPVDGEVTFGQWNEARGLWFSGQRPVYPKWWRPMPRLPRMKNVQNT